MYKILVFYSDLLCNSSKAWRR